MKSDIVDISELVEMRLRKMGIQIFPCMKCRKKIVWLRTVNGRMQPATMNLISHFADCPKAQEFRRRYPDKAN